MHEVAADRVREHIEAQRETLVSLLRELVEAESPTGHPAVHDAIRRVLKSRFRDIGYNVREVGHADGPRHFYARPAQRARGAPYQLVVGHYDTVWPLGTVGERPFRVDGDRIHGPGTFDMKGGIAQLIIALTALRGLGIEPSLPPVVFINADEEIGSRSSTSYIRLLAKHADRALVLEPAMGDDGAIKTERKGIGRFTVTVYGKAAHAGLDPDAGVSAILELSHVIQALFALNDPAHGVTVNVGTVDGGIHPNVVAPHSSAVVDVRVPTNADGKRIERAIHGLQPVTPGVRLVVDGSIGRPSMEATPRNEALWHHARAIGRDLGLELRAARAGGGSDGNTTSQFTATLDGLGPVGDGAHAEHEFLYIGKSLERAALLALLIASPPVAGAPS